MIAQKIISLIFLTGGTAVSAHFVDSKNLFVNKIYELQNLTDTSVGSISFTEKEKQEKIKEKITEFKQQIDAKDKDIKASNQKITEIFSKTSQLSPANKTVNSKKDLIHEIQVNNLKVSVLKTKIKQEEQKKTTLFNFLEKKWNILANNVKINSINKLIAQQTSYQQALTIEEVKLEKQEYEKMSLINVLVMQENLLE